jgi:hypothetical protein
MYEILLELFGYLGSALVIASMMMTSLIVINVIQLLRARPSGCSTPGGAVDYSPEEYDADFAAS